MGSATTDRRMGLTGDKGMKAPVRVATTAAITLSGLQTIDNVALAEGDRVTVKDQPNAVRNGIYDASAGSWTRSLDANGNQDIVNGTTFYVTDGATNGGSYWYIVATNPIIVDTSPITFSRALTSGISTLSFIQAGANAVAWAAQDKMRERVTTADWNGSLPLALTDIGSAAGTLVVASNLSVTTSPTIPETMTLRVDNEAIISISIGQTLTINGQFECGRVQCFSGSGTVVFGPGACEQIFPEWWGAKPDGTLAGGGTDSTAAFSKAITAATLNGAGAVATKSISMTSGNYLIGNLTFPPASCFRGTGRHTTNLVCKSGTAGKWITDTGSASKIIMEGFAMYGRSEAGLTHGLQLGQNGTQHGTEGYIRDIWIYDVNAAASKALDIQGNVGLYSTITVQNCVGGIYLSGAANKADNFVVQAPTGRGADLSYTSMSGLHIEAPGNACLPLMISRNSDIEGLSISIANGTTISHLIELDAAATVWELLGFQIFFGSVPAGVTVSNGNMKRADGSYFGGNATAGSLDGIGNYSSNEAGQKLQNFVLRIVNTAGTLQHRITNTSGNATNFASRINGASASLTNTPTGADGATAMAAGGKIGSAATSVFWLDTVSQKGADQLHLLSSVYSSSGAGLSAIPSVTSIDINGVTRTRLNFQFYTVATGAVFALTTANISAGNYVQVQFNGHLS